MRSKRRLYPRLGLVSSAERPRVLVALLDVVRTLRSYPETMRAPHASRFAACLKLKVSGLS